MVQDLWVSIALAFFSHPVLVSAQLYSREKFILTSEAMEQHVFSVLWHANSSWRMWRTIRSKTVHTLPITALGFREEMRKMVVCFPVLLFDSFFINKSILKDLSVIYLICAVCDYMISRKVLQIVYYRFVSLRKRCLVRSLCGPNGQLTRHILRVSLIPVLLRVRRVSPWSWNFLRRPTATSRNMMVV